jgi:hypothetical protein
VDGARRWHRAERGRGRGRGTARRSWCVTRTRATVCGKSGIWDRPGAGARRRPAATSTC